MQIQELTEAHTKLTNDVITRLKKRLDSCIHTRQTRWLVELDDLCTANSSTPNSAAAFFGTEIIKLARSAVDLENTIARIKDVR